MIERLALAGAGLLLAASVAFAHPQHGSAPPKEQARAETQPQAPPRVPGTRNLQVFPKDISQERLMDAMQAYSRALGVQCSYCHVPGNFASDENSHKDAARGMMRMTARINAELLPAVPNLHAREVSCFTCHRGQASPPMGPDAPAAAPHRHGTKGHGERG